MGYPHRAQARFQGQVLRVIAALGGRVQGGQVVQTLRQAAEAQGYAWERNFLANFAYSLHRLEERGAVRVERSANGRARVIELLWSPEQMDEECPDDAPVAIPTIVVPDQAPRDQSSLTSLIAVVQAFDNAHRLLDATVDVFTAEKMTTLNGNAELTADLRRQLKVQAATVETLRRERDAHVARIRLLEANLETLRQRVNGMPAPQEETSVRKLKALQHTMESKGA